MMSQNRTLLVFADTLYPFIPYSYIYYKRGAVQGAPLYQGLCVTGEP